MGHEEITVRLTDDVEEGMYGYSIADYREVVLKTGTTGYLTFQTLIHELLHQLCTLHPIKDEEDTIVALAPGLADLLIGNAKEWCKLLGDLQKKGNRNGIIREK